MANPPARGRARSSGARAPAHGGGGEQKRGPPVGAGAGVGDGRCGGPLPWLRSLAAARLCCLLVRPPAWSTTDAPVLPQWPKHGVGGAYPILAFIVAAVCYIPTTPYCMKEGALLDLLRSSTSSGTTPIRCTHGGH